MKKIILLAVISGFVYFWLKDQTINVPTNDVSFSYIVKYSGHSTQSETLPMLVALHGNGDTAKNFYNTALDRIDAPARIVLIKGPLSYRRGDAWPWTAAHFKQYGTALSEAIELLASKYSTVGKPVLLGFSGGANMAYYQSINHGDSYSYIFPISGSIIVGLADKESLEIGAKVHAFHGRSDRVIPFSSGASAVGALQKIGIDVTFTGFSGGHHGIFTNMKLKISKAVDEILLSLE